METRIVETSLGPIPLTGRFGDDAPVVLLIRGAFAHPESLAALPEAVPPGWDCVMADLPGNGAAPSLAETSVKAFADAFDQAIGSAFGGRRLLVFGQSVGGLVAMALRAAEVRRLVLVDPPLSMAAAWPLRARVQPYLRDLPAGDPAHPFAWAVLGMAPDRHEERAYRDLLAGLAVPADVMLGGVPLDPPRPLPALPCLNSEADRELYGRHPLVSRKLLNFAGHDIAGDGPRVLLHVLFEACAIVAG